ncbi:hypothetical protein OHB35_01460 [Streptomyces phaeochromogenes]|uniref:Uncharacterized protein n=1 Tax=Streptomyces phaeochromogenes TaxID=1923 RepID=A0ABZ1H0B1_STRPH|nr:hypothetical protein [Streptomyces phaeochromogenes]WSD11982.1 hypothetical protein OHB35_01460 [Streptomyces phaeochromogenes]
MDTPDHKLFEQNPSNLQSAFETSSGYRDGAKRRPSLTVEAPSKGVAAIGGLGLVEAAHLSGIVPDGLASAIALTIAVVAGVAATCIKRNR